MFDPYGFFLLAKRLARGDESQTRTAVGRAYYSAFLLVRDKLGIQSRDPEVHRFVLEQLHLAGHHKIAQRLHKLRVSRNGADYDTLAAVSAAQAAQSLAWASSIIQWVRQP